MKLYSNRMTLLVAATIALTASADAAKKEVPAIAAPTGTEWNDPQNLSFGKLASRADFWHFPAVNPAASFDNQQNPWRINLDGKWKFNWVATPDERPAGFQNPGYDVSGWDDIAVPGNWNVQGLGAYGAQKYGKPIYVNQKVIFQHSVKVDDWKGGVMRTPPKHWTTYKFRNEVGSYRRSFTVPADWKGEGIYLQFDGVDSFFYLWVNGKYVGFSKNSRNAARFDITDMVQPGENTVAVEVYRNSDGSFLEAQDMFRLPGIFRSVWLYSAPKVQIANMEAVPGLSDDYADGTLNLRATVANLTRKNVKGLKMVYNLYAMPLYTDSAVGAPVATATVDVAQLKKGDRTASDYKMTVPDVKQWSAELPYRYRLVAQLQDAKGKVLEATAINTGFRRVEFKNLTADEDSYGNPGRYFLVNGKQIKLRGVNRHETNPTKGHAITRADMINDVKKIKQANINHVRNSHYPTDAYWYELCDRYGIYLVDEANVESHQYYYGEASLSHPVEWRAAHVSRGQDMVRSNVNHPSIIIWSLGNEAGPGKNFEAEADSIRAYDSTRPIHYERNNDISDMGSTMYPSIKWVREAVQGKDAELKYPFYICEYAHSMGNAVGNLQDYWDAMESTNHFMGGSIWDWKDQGLYTTDSVSNIRYTAYGGDFGDRPTDKSFVLNGIVFSGSDPKPQYWEVRKVYQNVGITPVDVAAGKIDFHNKNYFNTLGNYDIKYEVVRNGNILQSEVMKLPLFDLKPQRHRVVTLPYIYPFEDGAEYLLNIYMLANGLPWVEDGTVMASEQIPLGPSAYEQQIMPLTDAAPVASAKGNKGKKVAQLPEIKEWKSTGNNYAVTFNPATGTIESLAYNGEEVIKSGKGPKLDLYRALTDNDNWLSKTVSKCDLRNLRDSVTSAKGYKDKSGNMVFEFEVITSSPDTASFALTSTRKWIVTPQGEVTLQSQIRSNRPEVELPRMGYSLELPADYNCLEYYGRGPWDNYRDRKTSAFIGRYASEVAAQYVPFPRPQSTGNHEDTRWVVLSNGKQGVEFKATVPFAFTALPWSDREIASAAHPYQLPKSTGTHLHLDAVMTGLGGNSCGQGAPLPHDRANGAPCAFTFTIRPI